MKNPILACLTSLLCFGFFASVASAQNSVEPKSIVVDVNTGQVLSAHQAHHRWYPASLTKLMTAYVAFRSVAEGEANMQSPVKVSRKALRQPPSKMAYPVGTRMTLENALKMIIVKSANDIAVAIGESLYGSEAAFVAEMNRQAKRLQMSQTQFKNPNGLHDVGQYSSPRDFALLATQIRREFPQYAPWFSYDAIRAGQNNLYAYNLLLGRFAGADGMKTGYVCASGYNMVASATRGGRTLIAVVMGARSAETRAEYAARILNAGFEQAAIGSLQSHPIDVADITKTRDMRPIVCSEKARAQILSRAASAQKIVALSPYLTAPLSGPSITPVRVGRAGGPIPERALSFFAAAGVPVPTPRPDYTPAPSLANDSLASDLIKQPDNMVLRGAIDVPVPTPRPNQAL